MRQHEPSDQAAHLYVFIRTDIPVVHQIVQAAHAVYQLASLRREEGIPNIVLIGLPNVAALQRARAKLESNQIPHFAWIEPDNDLGFTSIATAALAGEQRKVLSNYRVYSTPVAQVASAATSKVADGGSTPPGRATTPSTEASVLA